MNEKYTKLVETLPKESEELWFEYNLEVNKIIQENQRLKEQVEHLDIVNCQLRKNIEKIKSENQQLKEQIKDIDFWNKEYTEEFYKNKSLKKQLVDVINILQIGIDTYNNDGDRDALFKVICGVKKLLETLENGGIINE